MKSREIFKKKLHAFFCSHNISRNIFSKFCMHAFHISRHSREMHALSSMGTHSQNQLLAGFVSSLAAPPSSLMPPSQPLHVCSLRFALPDTPAVARHLPLSPLSQCSPSSHTLTSCDSFMQILLPSAIHMLCSSLTWSCGFFSFHSQNSFYSQRASVRLGPTSVELLCS